MAAPNLDAASAELAWRDLTCFARRMMPGWQPARHLECIAKRLQDLSATPGKRLMLACLIRHGKSTIASQALAGWHLGRNPTHSVILASYSDALATNHSRISKHLIESDRFPFPHVKIASDPTSVSRFNLEQGGGLRALGTGAGIQGYGADLLILDDPLQLRHFSE